MKTISEFINTPSSNKAPMSVAEKQLILKAFENGVPVSDLARKMGRAPRTIRNYYQRLRGYPTRPYQIVQAQRLIRRRKAEIGRLVRARDAQIEEQKSKKSLINEARFYRSNFEPA